MKTIKEKKECIKVILENHSDLVEYIKQLERITKQDEFDLYLEKLIAYLALSHKVDLTSKVLMCSNKYKPN